jgi:ankyrin repeat protein
LTDARLRIPLHLAAESGYSKITEILLQHGSELGRLDENSQTALHLVSFI